MTQPLLAVLSACSCVLQACGVRSLRMGVGETDKALYRAAVRWGLLLAGLITAGMRVPELQRFYAQWRSLEGVNAAAEAYRNYFLIESLITLFVLGLGVTFFYWLEPRQKKAE